MMGAANHPPQELATGDTPTLQEPAGLEQLALVTPPTATRQPTTTSSSPA